MSRNRCLNPSARAIAIPYVPLPVGVKTTSIIVRMTGSSEIPDRAISFEKMGELMDAYDGATSEVNSGSPSTPKINKEQLRWQRMERQAEADYKRTEEEYDYLVHELTNRTAA
jgi:hypothetical protein